MLAALAPKGSRLVEVAVYPHGRPRSAARLGLALPCGYTHYHRTDAWATHHRSPTALWLCLGSSAQLYRYAWATHYHSPVAMPRPTRLQHSPQGAMPETLPQLCRRLTHSHSPVAMPSLPTTTALWLCLMQPLPQPCAYAWSYLDSERSSFETLKGSTFIFSDVQRFNDRIERR